jgi:hypothetical protein
MASTCCHTLLLLLLCCLHKWSKRGQQLLQQSR